MQERIIGAVVLVVFAVLVVPVFLNGPTEEPATVSQAVTLPGQDRQESRQQTIVLDRDRSQPVPASHAPSAEPVQASRKSARPPVAVGPQAKKTPAPGSSATGMWAVQLGSFSNKENAERLAADLREQGYAAFLSQLKTDTRTLQRVRVGPQKDRKSAEEIAARLAKSGHEGRVVPHP